MRRPSRIQSNRISNTPSRSGPRNVFGRMITLSSGDDADEPLARDLRLAVRADAVRAGSPRTSGCTFGTPYTAVDEM